MSSLNNEEQKKTIIGGVPVPWDEDPDLGEETAPAYEFPLVSIGCFLREHQQQRLCHVTSRPI